MLDPRLKEYMSAAYTQLGEYGYKTVLNWRKGKGFTKSNKELLERRVKGWLILKILFRHVDYTTTPPTLYRITEEEVNNFLRCVIHLYELNDYPVSPNILPTVRPIIITTGQPGNPGQPGVNGTDADIDVVPDDNEDEIAVEEVIISGIKTFKLSFDPYIAAELAAVIQGAATFEVGVNVDTSIDITSTKNKKDIVTLTCTNPTIDALLQPLVDLVQLNGVSQPVILNVVLPTISVNTTLTFQTDDGKTITSANDSISFYYPFLYGTTDVTTGFNYYTFLTKLIEAKSDKSFILNGTDKYFWIAYPASYGDLVNIKDNNGFDLLAAGAWTKIVDDVTSSGLDTNWTHSYNLYRSTVKTSIDNLPYTIEF